jgi:outer membrane protein OmpA-like peptidoglycan-associated protein
MLPVTGSPAGQVAFVRDEVRESYRFADGSERSVEGHVLLFLSGLSLDARQAVVSRIREELDSAHIADISVEETATGVRLTIAALRFLPDQAVLLPEERGRLDSIAATLRGVDNARFLIVGHTADVGSEESQQILSVERAEAIAAALAGRGISPDLLDVEGRGGSEPVAPNDSETGRAQNRRVEIYVLEQ